MGRRGHGEGTIYREKDGTWRAALTLPPEAGGGPRYFSALTRHEVQKKLTAEQRAEDDGGGQVANLHTVAQFLTSWLQTIKPTMDYGAWRRHEQFVRLHILPLMGFTRLAALSAQQIQALYADRLSAGLSTSSVHHLHATVHKALKDAEP